MLRNYIFLLFLLPSICFSQNQERKVLVYNIGLGGFTAAIGAVINKPKHTDGKKYFVKGFWQGSTGGVLSYSGKKILHLISYQRNLAYGWPSKILHAAGTSIIENAALNKPYLKYWNIDYGPLRFDFAVGKNAPPLKVRLLPTGIYAIIQGHIKGQLDVRTSISTGSLAYRSKKPFIYSNGGYYAGLSYGRAFLHNVTKFDSDFDYELISHEINHVYQYRDYNVINSWFNPVAKKWAGPKLKKLVDRYIYPDVPCFYYIYPIEGYHSFFNYYRNFFEFESERFATNRFVKIN
jgi:hypothetical protein